jgi:hypothetical protein
VNVPHEHIKHLKDAMDFFTRDGQKIWGDPRVVYQFLLDRGQEFSGTKWTAFRGTGYRKMTPALCFNNCFHAAYNYEELTYYEGYATSNFIMPVHHAWCVDEQGRVVDFTWRAKQALHLEEEWEYFGIGFDVNLMLPWWLEKGTASVLYDLDYDSNYEELIAVA